MNSGYGDSIEVCYFYQLFYLTNEYSLMMNIRTFYFIQQQQQDYEVLGMLGKGGFAQVFRAISKNNGQEVAIKRVSENFAVITE